MRFSLNSQQPLLLVLWAEPVFSFIYESSIDLFILIFNSLSFRLCCTSEIFQRELEGPALVEYRERVYKGRFWIVLCTLSDHWLAHFVEETDYPGYVYTNSTFVSDVSNVVVVCGLWWPPLEWWGKGCRKGQVFVLIYFWIVIGVLYCNRWVFPTIVSPSEKLMCLNMVLYVYVCYWLYR